MKSEQELEEQIKILQRELEKTQYALEQRNSPKNRYTKVMSYLSAGRWVAWYSTSARRHLYSWNSHSVPFDFDGDRPDTWEIADVISGVYDRARISNNKSGLRIDFELNPFAPEKNRPLGSIDTRPLHARAAEFERRAGALRKLAKQFE